MKSPKKLTSACLFSLTDGNFFQSVIFLPSMTWNTFVWAVTLVRLKQFENEVSPVLSLPDFDPSLTTYIRDSMALVQCMDAKKHKTFGDLATDYCRPLTSQSTSENNFWIDMTGYDFTRFAFQGCFGIRVFKCFQF
jgi:hypothetical protein